MASRTAFDARPRGRFPDGARGYNSTRGGISRREYAMVTIAPLAALDHRGEAAMHLRAAPDTGASPTRLRVTGECRRGTIKPARAALPGCQTPSQRATFRIVPKGINPERQAPMFVLDMKDRAIRLLSKILHNARCRFWSPDKKIPQPIASIIARKAIN